MSILASLSDDSDQGRPIAVMPLSRIVLECKMEIGEFVMFPASSAELSELRPIPNRTLEQLDDGTGIIAIAGPERREVCSDLTGFDIDVLERSPLIAFPLGPSVDFDWERFLAADYSDDVALLHRLNQHAEHAVDIVRFECCHFDLPETLPAHVGSWDGSGGHLGALVYSPVDHEAYLIAGPGAAPTAVVRGIGLELSKPPARCPPDAGHGEVGALARHGLSLYRDVLESSSETSRFVRAMTLLEYLACPDGCKNSAEVADQLAAHVANSAENGARFRARFREINSYKVNGKQLGCRARIVHYGDFLESIVPGELERRALFKQLQGWGIAVLTDMLDRETLTWEEFLRFRRERALRVCGSPLS